MNRSQPENDSSRTDCGSADFLSLAGTRFVSVDFSKLDSGSVNSTSEDRLKFVLTCITGKSIVLRIQQTGSSTDSENAVLIRKDSDFTSSASLESRSIEIEIKAQTEITFWSHVDNNLNNTMGSSTNKFSSELNKRNGKGNGSSKCTLIYNDDESKEMESSSAFKMKTARATQQISSDRDTGLQGLGRNTYTCDQCPKYYTTQAGLKNHGKQHRVSPHALNDQVVSLKPKVSDCECCQYGEVQTIDSMNDNDTNFCTENTISSSDKLAEHIQPESESRMRYLSNCLTKPSPKKGVKCPMCKEMFPNRLLCRQHQTSHTEERPFICSVCGKGFKSSSNLRTHKLSHLSEKPHRCGICGKTFIHRVTLLVHSRSHTGEKPYTCRVCDKRFVSSNTLRKHERWMHFEERPLKCEECGKRFSQQSYLEAHMRTHMEVNPFKCDTCGRRYKHPYVLKVHKRIHTEGAAHMCQFCGKLFSRLGDLKAHLPTHTKERPYSCDICGKTFTQCTTLNVHKKSHRAEKPIYHCKDCDKTFAHSSSLYKHIGKIHQKDKMLKCHICGQTYTNSGHLRSHIRGHAERPTYTCPVCEKGYTRQRELRIHIMTHTGEKPFTCDVCGKGFRRKSQLKTHTFIHETERHFLCDLCGMKFKQLPSLQGHRKTHTEFKPHTCDICGKGFRVNSKLERHKLSHIRKQGTGINMCSLTMEGPLVKTDDSQISILPSLL